MAAQASNMQVSRVLDRFLAFQVVVHDVSKSNAVPSQQAHAEPAEHPG
jgi:hypothetical protein